MAAATSQAEGLRPLPRFSCFSKTGELLASAQPNAQGEFEFAKVTAAEYRIQADSQDGHRAEWWIGQTEFTALSPSPAGSVSANTKNLPDTSTYADLDELDRRIEQAWLDSWGRYGWNCSRPVIKLALSDIIGGIGFIVGLAGAALWWRSRR